MPGRIISPLGQRDIEQLNKDLAEIAADPFIEDGDQERTPFVGVKDSIRGDVLDDRDQLDETRADLIAKEVIEVQRAIDIFRTDRGEHRELDTMRFHHPRGADDGVPSVETVPRERHIRGISRVVSGLSPAFTDRARLHSTHNLAAAEEHWLCHGILLRELNVARKHPEQVTTGRDRMSDMLSVRREHHWCRRRAAPQLNYRYVPVGFFGWLVPDGFVGRAGLVTPLVGAFSRFSARTKACASGGSVTLCRPSATSLGLMPGP